jgi:regulator of sigma E protease
VDGQKVDSWEGVQTATVLARTNVVSVVIERNGTNKTYALKTIVSEALGLKVINLDPRDHPVVVQVNSGTPAEAAGLKSGDEIVALEKLPVYGQDHFMKLIQKRAGQSTEITVKRRQEHVTVNVTPKTDPTTGRGIIGIMLSSSAGVVYHVQRPGPTPWAQVEEVWDRTIRTFGALLHSKETGVGAKDLSGPVGIFAMLAAQVSIDYRLALHFMVLLNISLAMINLLPLPVLDGGHIAMSLLEWVRRRPLNVKFVEYATTVFAVVLISFMLYVTFFDLKRFPLWKSLFGREMQIEEPAHGSGTTSNSTSPAR